MIPVDPPAVVCEAPELAVRTEVYLGHGRPGPDVSRGARDRFLRDEVAPAFPGFTLIEGWGWWEGQRERSSVLVVLHPADRDPSQIALRWALAMGQTSVLLTREPASACLIAP